MKTAINRWTRATTKKLKCKSCGNTRFFNIYEVGTMSSHYDQVLGLFENDDFSPSDRISPTYECGECGEEWR